MANKKETKKELKCKNCQFYNYGQCTHQDNIGILINHRRELRYYLKSVKDLEKTCKNYKENV